VTMRELIETTRSFSALEDIASEFTKLRRSGAQFVGLCPLHSESTPSFYVHPAKQVFHCWGCGAAGDVFTFVMRINHMTFPQALEFLAARVGIQIQGFSPTAEMARKGQAANRKREQEIAFEKFSSDRLDAIAQHCWSLGRAATWAERFLTSGIADAALEDLAWSSITAYHSYHVRVEREEVGDVNTLRTEWVDRRGEKHVAER
jgi:DNA primase